MLYKTLFQNNTVSVAKQLLHYALLCVSNGTIVGGHIVETEAYTENDPCSHSYRGQTQRNRAMFLRAGHIYVYRIYGIHLCVNIVTAQKKCGEAVLIRAIKPLWGIEHMKKQRSQHNVVNLCNGPGKLTQALSISMYYNTRFCSLVASMKEVKRYAENTEKSLLCLMPVHTITEPYMNRQTTKIKKEVFIAHSTRIGVSEENPKSHRFYYKDNIYVSKKK